MKAKQWMAKVLVSAMLVLSPNAVFAQDNTNSASPMPEPATTLDGNGDDSDDLPPWLIPGVVSFVVFSLLGWRVWSRWSRRTCCVGPTLLQRIYIAPN